MKASAFSLLYDCFSSTNALIGLQNGAEKNSGQSRRGKKNVTVPFRDMWGKQLRELTKDVVGRGGVHIH